MKDAIGTISESSPVRLGLALLIAGGLVWNSRELSSLDKRVEVLTVKFDSMPNPAVYVTREMLNDKLATLSEQQKTISAGFETLRAENRRILDKLERLDEGRK